MNIPLSKEAHIAIRYAIMHAFEGKIDPKRMNYVIQRAPKCPVCGGENTAFGVESTHTKKLDPGDRLFHHVCSNCFAQVVVCTDHVKFNIINIGYINTTTGILEFYCTENQYPDGSEFYIEGKQCDKDMYLNYLSKVKKTALTYRDRSIADSEKFFVIEGDSEAKPNFPMN